MLGPLLLLAGAGALAYAATRPSPYSAAYAAQGRVQVAMQHDRANGAQPLPDTMLNTLAMVQANGTDAQRVATANYLHGLGYTQTAEVIMTNPKTGATVRGW